MARTGGVVTDIVDRLDAMFTDDEGTDDRLLISVYAADEITRLRMELAKTTQDLADAKTLLADALPRIVDGIRLRAENASLRLDVSMLIEELDGRRGDTSGVTFP